MAFEPEIVTVKADYVVKYGNKILLVDTTAGPIRLTMPPVGNGAGQADQGYEVDIKDFKYMAGTNPITIVPDTMNKLENTSSYIINKNGGFVIAKSDGVSNWFGMGDNAFAGLGSMSTQNSTNVSVTGGNISSVTFTAKDDVFTLQDNVDSTKQVKFELSGITTASTVTLTAPNKSGTLALTSDIGSRTFTTPTRALNTAFQISTTKDTLASYSVNITVAALLLAGASGTVTLEYADNSGMTTNLVTVANCTNSTSGVLSITNTNTANLSTIIPAGKFVRLRTTNNVGTPTYAIVAQSEVLL